ncbi:CHU domain-containing protein [Algoriphagus aquaeductus]|uniref:CHU domain-containing protein n=2 Tax=Algoriphagus aquaeductus TaxID=475299 RepID=A0A326RZ19_9BACT|nr:CHU domain-containing protein [Algoriphagus aquaeductus]
MRVGLLKIFLYSILLQLFWLGKVFPVKAQMSTIGKEFWVGFMENNRVLPSLNNAGAPDYWIILITASENATGVIEYAGNSTAFSLTQGQQFTLRVGGLELDMIHRTSGIIENKGIHITSSGKVAVHAFNERFRSADGTVVLPVGALGKDHYITSHFETNPLGNLNQSNESTLLVVASEENTRVEITLAEASVSGDPKGTPYEITLNRGQSYQIKARGDLTGSRVRVVGDNADDCKKIAVFGGNKWTSVGSCGNANDHLFQQTYPVNTWGNSFIHVALAGRSSGELVKVLASEDNTEVSVNGNSIGVLNRGQWMPIEFEANESAKIATTKPSSVTVFSKSQACNQPNAPNSDFGDPFMISYSPVEQFLTQLTFNAINLPSIVNHYVNIVVKSGDQAQTRLDGQSIGSSFSPLPGDPNFQIARVSIFQGVHTLTNPSGFAAYVYGFGEIESYGYAAGAALNNLNFQTENKYEFEVTGDKVACLNQPGDWTINPQNPNFTYFVWDFGDESESKTGKVVSHKFLNPGTYEVKVVASLSPNSCDEQEEIAFEVQVLETDAEIIGEQSVCPEVEQVMYRLKNKQKIGKTVFEVEGGTILESFGDSVLVNWGPANPNAILRMIPYTENGCPGEPIELNVVINQRIEVTEATGVLEVCFDPAVRHTYTAPNAQPGRGYEWVITGGTLVSTQGSPQAEVVWDQPGITGTIAYTAYSLVDNSCEGKSPAIEVKVAPDFQAEVASVTSVLCFGESTGQIRLTVTGGQAPYKFEWSHQSTLNAPEATNLKAGIYSVKIIDQLGCEKFLEDIAITEPDQLNLIQAKPQATSCYGKSDGEVLIQIEGGISPYSLVYDGLKSFSSDLKIQDLAAGSYNWEVTDSNGCKIPVSFEITSPAAVLVDVRLEKPACPGGSNGELFVVPSGNSGPFLYQWSDPVLSGQWVSGLSVGDYSVEVTDSFGCVSIGKGTVSEAKPQFRMPTGFDSRQAPGIYQGVSNCDTEFQLSVYNRWGQLIYFGKEGWDGTISGELAPGGTYSYSVNYYYQLEGKSEVTNIRGSFILIR